MWVLSGLSVRGQRERGAREESGRNGWEQLPSHGTQHLTVGGLTKAACRCCMGAGLGRAAKGRRGGRPARCLAARHGRAPPAQAAAAAAAAAGRWAGPSDGGLGASAARLAAARHSPARPSQQGGCQCNRLTWLPA